MRLPWCHGFRRHAWITPFTRGGPGWCERCGRARGTALTFEEAEELLDALRIATDNPRPSTEGKLLALLCAGDVEAAA